MTLSTWWYKNIFFQFIENNTLQTNQQLWLPQTFIDVHSLFYTKRLHLYSNGYIWQNGYSANWLCLKSQQLHNRPFCPKRLSIWLHWTNFIDNVLILCIMRTAITWWIEAWCQKRIPVIFNCCCCRESRERKRVVL